MFVITGLLLTAVLLFALCKTEERAMEFQREYWMKNHKALDRIRWGWSY